MKTSEQRNPFNVAGRNVIVVGAGSGIGRAVALGLAEQGARVTVSDINEAPIEELAKDISTAGGIAQPRVADVRDLSGLREMFNDVAKQGGGIDGVVATPSINVRKRILDYSDDEFDRVVDLNLKGSFHVLQAAGHVMREQRRGSIVIFSSIRSLVVEPGQAVYAATKAGTVQLVRTLASELGEFGVRVNAVAPGVVETPLTEPIRDQPDWYQAYAEKNVLKRWASADEMAGPAVFLISDASSYVTGTVLFVDGGWTAADGRFTPP